MNADQSKNPSSEQRLNEILAQFLEAERTGQAPTADKLKRQNPDLADELDSFFANRDHFQQLAGGDDTATIPPQSKIAQDASTLGPDGSAPAAGGTVRYFGDYELLEEIARGGMGVVFKARQVSLNRTVALKMILAGNLASEDDVQRFRREAEAAANLDHPNIVPIYEVGEHGGQQYFSMKLVEGGSLAEILSRRGAENAEKKVDSLRNPRLCVRLLTTIARAVHHAHLRGILHRDLKPGNILIDQNGEPLVTDFGLAKKVEGDAGLTRSGAIVGTPAYMAPEQARAEKDLTVAADVYSLGAIMYEMLTGKPPFRAETPLEVVLQVLEREPEPLRRIKPEIDRDLETICLKCLAKDPSKRYASADDLAQDMERWLSGEAILARPVSRPERVVKWVRRHPVVSGLLSLVFVVTLTGVVSFLWAYGLAIRANHDLNDTVGKLSDLTGKLEKEIDRTTQLSREKDKQLEFSRRALFVAQLQRINAIHQRDPLKARILLDDEKVCLPRLRGPAWRYFDRQCERWVVKKLASPEVFCLAFSPDGKTLACGSGTGKSGWLLYKTGRIIVWDMETGKKRLIRGHTNRICALSFSPDGKTLASVSGSHKEAAGTPGDVILWDVETGVKKTTFRAVDRPMSLSFSPDGTTLAVGCFIGFCQLFDVDSGQEKAKFRHGGLGTSVCFSPDSQTVATGTWGGNIKIWDVNTKKSIATFLAGGEVTAVRFSPDGATLASARGRYARGVIQLWDVATGRQKVQLQGHHDGIASLSFRADGRILASGEDLGNTIKLWDVHTGQEVVSLPGGGNGLRFSPVGATLASGGQFINGISIWNVNTNPAQRIIKAGRSNISSISLSPNGETLSAADNRNGIRLWNVDSGQQLAVLGKASHVCFHPGGKMLASSRNLEQQSDQQGAPQAVIELWDLATRKTVATFEGNNGHVYSLNFSPDGKSLASAGSHHIKNMTSHGEFLLWDVKSGRVRNRIKVDATTGQSIRFSPDGRLLATTGSSGSNHRWLKIWDASTLTEKVSYTMRAADGVFSPNGKLLASRQPYSWNAEGKSIIVWNLVTGKQAVKIDCVANALCFGDGQTLISADKDGIIRFWDVHTSQEKAAIHAHNQPITCLLLSRDGNTLISAGNGGVVKFWDLSKSNG